MQRQNNRRVPWVVNKLQIEFNSIAWALDTGYGFVLQNGTTIGRKGDCEAPEYSTEEVSDEDATEDAGES